MQLFLFCIFYQHSVILQLFSVTTCWITLWELSPFCAGYPGTFYYLKMPHDDHVINIKCNSKGDCYRVIIRQPPSYIYKKKKSRYDVLCASAEHELRTSRHTDSELRHSEDQTKPALMDQDQTSQDRTRPQQLRPNWARPDHTKPEQTIPDQAKPIESIPEQTNWD